MIKRVISLIGKFFLYRENHEENIQFIENILREKKYEQLNRALKNFIINEPKDNYDTTKIIPSEEESDTASVNILLDIEQNDLYSIFNDVDEEEIYINQKANLNSSSISKSQKIEKEKLLINLNNHYKPKILFHKNVVKILLSKKVDKIIIEKFLEKIDDLYSDKARFRENSIKLPVLGNVLEIRVLKDWRIYILPDGGVYKIYSFGHKNTQKRDISHIKKLIS